MQNPTEGPDPVLTPEWMAAEVLDPSKNPDLLLENRICLSHGEYGSRARRRPEDGHASGLARSLGRRASGGDRATKEVDLGQCGHALVGPNCIDNWGDFPCWTPGVS